MSHQEEVIEGLGVVPGLLQEKEDVINKTLGLTGATFTYDTAFSKNSLDSECYVHLTASNGQKYTIVLGDNEAITKGAPGHVQFGSL